MDYKGSMKIVSLVVPLFNEAAGLGGLFARLDALVAAMPDTSFEIVCVNDGSVDETLAELERMQTAHPNLVVVDLSRNFGKEAALSAGLAVATGDAVVPIDADLQDPPELIREMIAQWQNGYEVVLAHRCDRASDPFIKRTSANAFYKVHNMLSEVAIPSDVGDFRLLDRVAVDALNALPENRRFMKGLFAWVGFRTTTVELRAVHARRGRRASTCGACGTLRSRESRASRCCRCASGLTSAPPSRWFRCATAPGSSCVR